MIPPVLVVVVVVSGTGWGVVARRPGEDGEVSSLDPDNPVVGEDGEDHALLGPGVLDCRVLAGPAQPICLILFCFWSILLTSFSVNLHFREG